MKSICVYCGSNFGVNPHFQSITEEFGRLLAAKGITLVYGGANTGLMGVIANTVLEAGGKVVGVIPQKLVDKEVAHTGLTELHVVQSMHERKTMMADLSAGFVALPGGIGTAEELLETFTWSQLGFHAKACGILNVDGFYDGLLQYLKKMVTEKFLRVEQFDQLAVSHDCELLLTKLAATVPQVYDKWLGREELPGR